MNASHMLNNWSFIDSLLLCIDLRKHLELNLKNGRNGSVGKHEIRGQAKCRQKLKDKLMNIKKEVELLDDSYESKMNENQLLDIELKRHNYSKIIS